MKKIIFIIWILNSILIVSAQESTFSLNQAKEYAMEHSLEIANSRLDLTKAKKKVWETTAIGLPQVSASADFQNFLDIPTTVVPAKMFNPMAPEGEVSELKFGSDYTLNASLKVSQLIFSGNYLVGLQAARAFTNTSQVLVEKQELETKYNVSQAYYTVLLLEDNRVVLDSTLRTIEKLYQETSILVDEGFLESTGASQLKLSVLQVKNGLAQIIGQIKVAKKLLKFQMGMPIESSIELSDDMASLTSLESSLASIESVSNIDYKIVESQLRLNELAFKNTKANYLPSLLGFFSHQQGAQRNEFNFMDSSERWYPTTLWGLSLSLPIFSSGQKAAQVSQAKIELLKSENSLLNVDRAIELQISQAKVEYYSNLDAYSLQEESSNIAKEILNSTTIKFKEGVVSSMELSQAQNQLLSAQTALTTATFNLLKSKLTIDKLSNNL